MALVSSAIAGTVGTAVALAAAATGAAYMATDGFGSGGKAPKPPGQIAPPTREDAQGAGREVRSRRRTQTILTSPQGLADDEAALPTILGG